jgi:DNA-binding NarL/FixJ family response regulator
MSPSSQTSRRVLVIGDSTLLQEGIASLLMAELGLEVSNITYTSDTAFVQVIRDIQPEVVVLKESPSLNLARFFRLLRNVPFEQALRVIVLHVEDKTLDVYEKQRVIPTQSKDLVDLIRQGSSRSGPSLAA